MKRDVELSILRELLRQLAENVNVDAGRQFENPAWSYTSREHAAREWSELFRNRPQLIGLSGDLPEPGTHITVDDFGVPVLATRSADGVFRAFLNACRHRGTRVASEARGSADTFVCPFHHWTYSSAGALLSVPRERDFGAVDHACRGLIALPAEERFGQLWVHPDPNGSLDVRALLGGMGEELGAWGSGELVFTGESLIERDLNWKLAVDTFGETYHVARLHRNTLANFVHSDNLSYEPFGPHHRMAFAMKGIEALRSQPEREWTFDGNVNVIYFLFPNVQLNVGRNTASLVRIFPDPSNPGRSRTRVSHYFDRDAIAAAGEVDGDERRAAREYDRAADGRAIVMEVFDSAIEKEDYAAAETTQKAAESGLLGSLLFGRNEPALHHFHAAYREALGLPPL